MKRFIVSILFASVFFMGLGAIAGGVAAKFKSDDKALEVIRQARIAIGGEASIAAVRSMTINGRTTKTFTVNGETRTEPGETDIALQLPDKLMKMVKIGADGEGLGVMSKQHDVMILRSTKDGEGVGAGHGEGTATRKIIIKKDDGTFMSSGDGGKVWVEKGDSDALPGDGKRVVIEKEHRAEHEGMRQNELLRLTLGLLLTPPQGMDVNYTFAGEGDVDGTTCNVVNAEFAGSSVKLYISKASSLPVMLAYTGHQMPQIFQFKVDGPKTGDEAKKDVVFFRKDIAEPADAEFQIRFSDYRGVNGVQLPYRWVTTVNGKADETFDVNTYEINPSNIGEKFANRKVMVRIPEPVEQ